NIGNLLISNATALGDIASGTTVSTGAALQLESASGITFAAEPLDLSGTLENVSSNNTWTGTITLHSTIQVDSGTTLTASGQISGTGLTKTGAGTLVLSNTGNNYSGNTTISDGTLQVSGSSAIPDASAVSISATGMLDLQNDET